MQDEARLVRRRRSRAEGERLVLEFEHSGLGRREFCAIHGLSVYTLDAWRRRQRHSEACEQLVPVEIVEDRAAPVDSNHNGSTAPIQVFRILLSDGLRIEVDPGFDAAELRRLVATLAEA
jgi:hypothetical protein